MDICGKFAIIIIIIVFGFAGYIIGAETRNGNDHFRSVIIVSGKRNVAESIDCAGKRVNISTDNNNCGSCGMICKGDATCQSGSCLPCSKGKWNCETGCFDIKTDNMNCGGCGITCMAGKTCHEGGCS